MHRETWKFSASAKHLAKTRTVVDAVLAEQHPDDGSKLITKKKAPQVAQLIENRCMSVYAFFCLPTRTVIITQVK